MAVYVLLSFDDDSTAKTFVKDLIDASEPGGSLGVSLGPDDAKVRAVFKKPTKFCRCGMGGGKLGYTFTRGKKYGWWVHVKCGMPTKAWAEGDGWYATHGTNLLPVEIAPEYRPVGWESPAEWRDLVPIDLDHPNRKVWPFNATSSEVPSVSEQATAADAGGAT